MGVVWRQLEESMEPSKSIHLPDLCFLTENETAKTLNKSPRTLQRWRVDGNGPPFVRAGSGILYRPQDIEIWAAENTFTSTSQADAALQNIPSVLGKS